MVAAAVSLSTPRRAMVSPVVDTLCVGGLSIVVTALLLTFGPVPFDESVPASLPYLLTLGITWPHFLSSYRLLYADRESILRYRTASLIFPAMLAAYGLFAVARSPITPVHVNVLLLVSGVYLARHYTGQTWGMIATYSHLAGVPPSDRERAVMKWSLNGVMAWHVVWAAARTVGGVIPPLAPLASRLDAHIDPIAVLSFVVGLGALAMTANRTRALPPVRVVVPWLALYGWYALLRRDPTSIVIVQAAHALQYLVFPLRIEETRRGGGGPVSARRAAAWMAGLVALGLASLAGVPALFHLCYARMGGGGDLAAAFASVFVSFVNIHHYFIDGCLYKLRNPAVRRDLFAHLPAPSRSS